MTSPARFEYLSHRRWYAGKGRPVSDVTVIALPWLGAPDSGLPWRIELLRVEFADGGSHTYQMPLSYRREEHGGLGHAFVGWFSPGGDAPAAAVYDLPFDHDAATDYLRVLAAGASANGFTAHALDDALHTDARPLVLSGEQSNTSVVYGDRMLLKLFRRVQPGHNPDIEAYAALMAAEDSADVRVTPRLLAWLECDTAGAVVDGESFTGDLAMLTQFLPSATDGWALATSSVRDLLAEADLHADEVGGDFAAEAERLGQVTATMHRDLSAAFGEITLTREQLQDLTTSLRNRLDAASARVPSLAAMAERIGARYDEIAGLEADEVSAHRVHGDYHLGQTLRTLRGWKIIDFEGEPGAPYDARVVPDSPLRDVAGMLRSLDYAAEHLLADGPVANQSAFRAAEWRDRNTTAFLRGYHAGSGRTGSHDEAGSTDPMASWSRAEETLLRAYELDKAVYEVVYEADMRPDWIRIPLAALERLA